MTTRQKRRGSSTAWMLFLAGTLVVSACTTTEPTTPRAAEVARGEDAPATTSPDGSAATQPSADETAGAESGSNVSDQGRSEASDDGSSSDAGPSPAPDPADEPSSPESTPDRSPGVSDTEVRIGFITQDRSGADQAMGSLGGDLADQGDADEQVHAIVDWLNPLGGIAGKTIVPIIVRRDPNSSDPNHAESICRSLTEDHEVFAAMDSAGQTAPCYAEHETLLLANSFLAESLYQETAPHLWSPSLPSLDAGYRAYVDGLAAQDFFPDPPGRLGIVGQDSATGRRMYEEVALPRLTRVGVGDHSVAYVQGESNADLGFVAQQIQTIILQFREDGVTHVMFMRPGGGVPLVFMQSAEQQQYRPTYGLSTYDQPGLVLQGSAPEAQMQGSVGVGWSLSLDVDPERAGAYPAGKGERQCLEALEAGDVPPASRANATFAHVMCDGAFMLHEAGKNVDGELTTETWTAAASELGAQFQGAFGLPDSTRFVPGRPYGGSRYRHLNFDESCSCYVYTALTTYEIPFR